MRRELTQPVEDYLKVIYELSGGERRAGTNEIAERLGVSPASASEMVKKLSETHPPLVDYQKHRGAVLTPAGEQVALEILRHHRLIETFLTQVLGYTWDEVHPEADRLEHVISEEFEERIARLLGDPQNDPHGDPIPSRELDMPPATGLPLDEALPGERLVIERVPSADPALLRYLSENGLTPGNRLEVLEVSPFDENLVVQVEGQPGPLTIGPKITRRILVERTKQNAA